jgi:hypothetical protein
MVTRLVIQWYYISQNGDELITHANSIPYGTHINIEQKKRRAAVARLLKLYPKSVVKTEVRMDMG